MLNRLISLPAKAEDAIARRLFGREHFVVFRDYPVVYGRVPKAANSTVKVMLARLLSLPQKRVSPDDFWKHETGGETSMVRTREAAGFGPDKIVFTFTRNPFSRLASFHDNKIADPQAGLPLVAARMGLRKGMSFPEVVEIVCATPAHKMDVHVLPQSDMLVHRGRIVPAFIGRHETFEPDWERLRAFVIERGGPDLGAVRIKKKGPRSRNLADYYDDRLRAMVRERYKRDLELFYPETS